MLVHLLRKFYRVTAYCSPLSEVQVPDGVSDLKGMMSLILRDMTIQTLRDHGLRIFNALQIQDVEIREIVWPLRMMFSTHRTEMAVVGVAILLFAAVFALNVPTRKTLFELECDSCFLQKKIANLSYGYCSMDFR